MKHVASDDFKVKMQTFFEGCIKIYNDYMNSQFPTNPKDAFELKYGGRYVKVTRLGSGVHCFVDISNGDVLKAASFNAPAKKARGNIFNPDNGLSGVDHSGAKYLRG